MGSKMGKKFFSLTNDLSIFGNNGYQSNLSKFHQIDNFPGLTMHKYIFLQALERALFLRRIQQSKISAELLCFCHLCYKQVVKNKFLLFLSQLQFSIAAVFPSYSTGTLASLFLFLFLLYQTKKQNDKFFHFVLFVTIVVKLFKYVGWWVFSQFTFIHWLCHVFKQECEGGKLHLTKTLNNTEEVEK